MMNIVATRAGGVRSILGFLMLLCAACQGRQLTTSADAADDAISCANVGCAAPPLCSAGCQATCGCCTCTPGQRNGELVCTSAGCYEPAPASDGGSDVGGGGPLACQLPFEVGPCDAAIPVYAFVNGACVQRTYGGCEGNGNRFSTLEECLATCAGQPVPGGCPPNRVAREICLACGLAGGCAKMATVCALVCDADAGASACVDIYLSCYQGVCQVAHCI
jgi:hypothetical protein